MFPLRDENPTARKPVAVIAIIALNAWAWGFVQGFGGDYPLAESLCLHGLIPGELLGLIDMGRQLPMGRNLVCTLDGRSNPATLLTSMFLHGGWFHILGNLWFLWVFGDNIEDVMGPLRFIVFYLLCGLAAAFAQILSDPGSAIPMVGASGAIGGVMGAYALLFPRARVQTLLILGFYVTTIGVPAFVMLGYWFLLQVLGGLPALGSSEGGVAFWAHIGGFVAGLALIHLFRRPDHASARRQRQPRRSPPDKRWF
ncbi:MAG: rhomboid family intramembrane serine protease [Gammaproteobacteria bacterium]|nr:rhomboid family intramembrane serine protease [Gammaproteobacteria bacterium]